MSDIKLVLRYCHIEHIPVEDSAFHRTLIAMGMQDASERLSYEVELPRDDDVRNIPTLDGDQREAADVGIVGGYSFVPDRPIRPPTDNIPGQAPVPR